MFIIVAHSTIKMIKVGLQFVNWEKYNPKILPNHKFYYVIVESNIIVYIWKIEFRVKVCLAISCHKSLNELHS
jgi:hypothetical protein